MDFSCTMILTVFTNKYKLLQLLQKRVWLHTVSHTKASYLYTDNCVKVWNVNFVCGIMK